MNDIHCWERESRMELFSSAWCRAADEPFPGKTIVYRVPIQKRNGRYIQHPLAVTH